MKRRGLTLGIAGVLLAGLIAAGAVLPVPYVALEPGPVFNMLGTSSSGTALVAVSGHPSYPDRGRLYALTVSVVGDPKNEPSLFTAVRGWLAGDTAVVPLDLLYPPGENVGQVQQQNQQDMAQSQQNATAAALRYLGYPVHSQVQVGSVTAGTPAQGKLRAGDVLLAVDAHPVTGAAQLRSLITAHPPGQDVTLTIRRDGHRSTVTVGTIAVGTGTQRRAVVGFVPTESFVFPFHVTIHGLEDVGGPSAGMMLALSIIDRLTPGSLTDGRVIAGTGTIDPQGNVGPIGGAQQKVVAAAAHGARIVLIPAGDCSGARSAAPSGVRLVKVTTLAGAVAALRVLEHGGGNVPTC